MTIKAPIKFPLTMKIDSQEMLDHLFKEVEYGWFGLKDTEGNIRHFNSYKDSILPLPPGIYRFNDEGEMYKVEDAGPSILIQRLSQEGIDDLDPKKDDLYYNTDLEGFVYFDGDAWQRADPSVEEYKRIIDDRLKAEAK